AVCLTLPGRGRPAQTPAKGQAGPAQTKKVELHRLTNEELLKKAAALYAGASRDYLAQRRAPAVAPALLPAGRKQTAPPDNPPPPPRAGPGAGPPAGEAAARKAVDAARARKDVVGRKLKLVQTQKELLDRVTAGLEACRSAALAFQNALDGLKSYALEGG